MHIINPKLIEAANKYYNGHETGMTDKEYDELLQKEKNFNPKFSIFDYVHYEGQFTKQRHSIKIPSWEKTTDWNLLETIDNEEFVATPKFDGCSIVVYYTEGKLNNILTRSNEYDGIVQTEKLKNKVPQSVDPKVKAILCEAVCIESRQKANGLINSKYKQDEVDELITLMPFDVITDIPMTYTDRFKLVGVNPTIITKDQALEIKDKYTINIQGLGPVPADGVVFYPNVHPTYKARILKLYGADFAETVITDVQPVFSSDTMTFSLVYWFEPVILGNINVKRVGNAGSYTKCKEKKLGKGSKVEVKLTKQVIPQFKSTGEWNEKLDQNIYCPFCGHKLVEFEGKLVCINHDCISINEFFIRKYLNYLRIKVDNKDWNNGPNTIEKFKSRWELKDPTFVDLIRKEPNFKFYCCQPPRLRDPYYFFNNDAEIKKFINNDISYQQKTYFGMIFNKLKIFMEKMEEK